MRKQELHYPPPLCFCCAKYRGGVRRTEGLENTDSGGDRVRTPLPLLIVDEIGGVPVGRGVGISDINRTDVIALFNPSVTTCHLLYILFDNKTQGRRAITFCIVRLYKSTIPSDFLLRSYKGEMAL